MSFQPADNLNNRTFIGLIIAQFLAGFNDQAIHAASMFYAIHHGLLTEAQAISLMPLLFYAPWAIFCTTSAFLADRFSKTSSIVVWKFSEIGISIFLTIGFYLGTVYQMNAGIWIVLSCVFLMGAHAAFFSPAKYGAMPEVLRGHVLSKGNGVLESSTFLANILGTVCGGLLSFALYNREYYIGIILLVLSVIGAFASLMMEKLPASDPTKKFSFIKPLTNGFRDVFTSRPLALSVMGIAFFIFMVSYMRSTMYMHGQTRVPPWDDFETSLVVASVALGVGLGSPLAGWMSGGKIELGLVPIGCIGMIVSCVFAAFLLNHEYALVAALIGIGFFSGYYMVPLYSLLQHRAPKKSKGEIVAVSNFVNVTGAMSASLLFFLLVQAGRATNITPVVEQTDNVIVGKIAHVQPDDYKHVIAVTILDAKGKATRLKAERTISLLTLPAKEMRPGDEVIVSEYTTSEARHSVIRFKGDDLAEVFNKRGRALGQKDNIAAGPIIEIAKDDQGKIESVTLTAANGEPFVVHADKRTYLLKLPGQGVKDGKDGDEVIVSRYRIHDVIYNIVRFKGEPMKPAYDNEALPKYLFFGAGAMTLAILILLCWKLPDFFVRTLFWWRSFGKRQLKAIHMDNLPTSGPVILATNCDTLEESLQMVSATDRHVVMLLAEKPNDRMNAPLLRTLAKRSSLVNVPPAGDWSSARPRAAAALKAGELLGVTIDGIIDDNAVDTFLSGLAAECNATIVPVWCGPIQPGRIRVVFGEKAPPGATVADLRREIANLETWMKANDHTAGAGH